MNNQGKVVSLYVGLTTVCSNYTAITRNGFSRAALANKNVYIARDQRQGSKPGTRQNAIHLFYFFFFFFFRVFFFFFRFFFSQAI